MFYKDPRENHRYFSCPWQGLQGTHYKGVCILSRNQWGSLETLKYITEMIRSPILLDDSGGKKNRRNIRLKEG